MKELLWFLINITFVYYVVACSPTNFEKNASCGSNCGSVVPTSGPITHSSIVDSGKLDILIVDDNSASMSTEQHQMASRFSSLISALESRGIDYRIAITTTDISLSSGNSPRQINLNGGLQDGRLIQFSDGSYFLTPGSQNRETLFSNAIQRNETINCETFLAANTSPSSSSYNDHCPSGDERGIFAANLVVKNNPNSFLRSDASLAVVFLSDEDVRSSLYSDYLSFNLSSEDLPQTLISNVSSLYPGKNFAIHAIIVRPGNLVSLTPAQAMQKIALSFSTNGNSNSSGNPSLLFSTGDTSCLNMQNSQTNNVKGSFGYLYSLGTRMTGGVEGDICASDYGSQLTTIGNNAGTINSVTLVCSNPKNLNVQFLIGSTIGYTVSQNILTFNTNLPVGSKVKIDYQCE